MAANESPAGARPGRAETPPADHWQRWTPEVAPPAVGAPMAAAPPAVAADVPAPANGAPPPLPGPIIAAEAGNNDLAPPSSDSPYRVLIVEDDRAQALFAQSVLHGAGMQAIVHSDADGALQAIKEHRPDLILMDVVMPNLNGFQATRTISKDPATAHIPVILVTTKDQDTDMWGMRQGAKAYVTKPIKEDELVATLAELLPR